MSNKYRNPSGFPENLPAEQIVEESLKLKMSKTCELFGYTPLETPAVEYIETISSKGEVNKEIYTISRALGEGGDRESDRALRFDLTVPLARYVAQHYGDLTFPFKRYQIQKVWRGERPQKGRFREFYQADIDVIANEKLPLYFDAEVISIIYNVLNDFNIGNFTIHINNRKFLQGILEVFNIKNIETALKIIDKIDKVGLEVTKKSLETELKINSDDSQRILNIISKEIPISDIENFFNKLTLKHDLIKEGQSEILEIVEYLKNIDAKTGKFVFNPRIARGLDYYTGSVYETSIDGLEKYGSICSGGRYANLAGKFINKKLPGVGVSIGLTRLLDIIKNEKLVSFEKVTLTNVVIGVLNEYQRIEANKVASKLREVNINTEVFHNSKINLSKQIQYQIKKNIKHFIVINKDSTFTVKTLKSSEEVTLSLPELLSYLK